MNLNYVEITGKKISPSLEGDRFGMFLLKPGSLHRSFVLVAQAACAKVKMFLLAFNHKGGRVYIGRPVPVGMAFGVADIRTEHGSFPAYITLQFSKSPLVSRNGILQNLPIHSNIMR
jgi:hypothetical protein